MLVLVLLPLAFARSSNHENSLVCRDLRMQFLRHRLTEGTVLYGQQKTGRCHCRISFHKVKKVPKVQNLIMGRPIKKKMLSTLPTINEQEKSTPRRSRFLSTQMADACLDWVVFPSLLFVQFGATLYCQHNQDQDQEEQQQEEALAVPLPSTLACMLHIALFCVVAGIYRQVIRRHPTESLPVLLLPEFMTNLLLAWVMIGSLDQALVLLRWSTGLLLVIGGVTHVHSRILNHRQSTGVSMDAHYHLLVDKKTTGQDDEADVIGAGDADLDEGSDEEWVC